MRGIAQFTTAEGRRLGIPSLAALIVFDVSAPAPDRPEGASTLVRYSVGQQQRIAWLRDPFKHVLSCLPMSAQGPWAHVTDVAGADLVFARQSMTGYEEVDDDVFRVTLDGGGVPIEVMLRTSFEDLEKVAGMVKDEEANHGSDPGEDRVVHKRRRRSVES